MSSGEAALYALTKGAAQVLGLSSMSADFGEELGCTVRSDSSAALAISQRVGLGKVRHIQVQYLWIQERHYEGSLSLHFQQAHWKAAEKIGRFHQNQLKR